MNEKWEEICFLLSENVKQEISESEFEQNVIQALRVLNWKEFTGDIQIRPSFQFGATNRIMPDIVINSSNKKNLFVIEIKQPNIPLTTRFQQQLFSYMRQLRLQYGILIGEAIQLFYDGDLAQHDDPVLLETIQIDKGDSKGQKFVELFSKDDFTFDKLNTFTENSLKRINRKADQKVLTFKILSQDYQSKVLDLIKQDFLKEYDAELIDSVLNDISINISANQSFQVSKPKPPSNNGQKPENTNSRDTTKYILNGNGEPLAKNRFVFEFVRQYFRNKPSNFSSLKNTFKKEFQGSTGVINEFEYVQTKYANKSNKRHFTAENQILESTDGVKFVVSTEWGKHNIAEIIDLARREGFQVDEV
ncbi:type I restriction enzyme HsdR N-terminal domain-containing protein [Algoriphagus chordae]|uniref:Type I restriction and modification enzyme subunit R-like protein n=1 Tax=Algoriphagus chordae TaxID=237019 RepID=A0A2W7QNP2_9BACT|nr:type I restriction enzyme HsdR N-terminal domain-containing protein [Algoriphagus chordae]PZX50138.1 type I restriction and modification enzyme subunit R-like protein [Algoriphagus chordae]